MRAVGTLITAIAALHAAPTPETTRGAVTAVRVAPAAANGGTEVAVHVGREVEVQDFVLDSPRRVVIDINGATLAHTARAYDRVTRGGVTNVRLSQFRAGVVRVVVELDGNRKYEIRQADGDVRIVVKGATSDFAPWQSGDPSAIAVVAATKAAAPNDTPQVASRETPKPAPKRDEPKREEVKREEPKREEPKRAEPVRRVTTAPRITVTYQDADIHDVISAFAAFSGRTIIIGREVTGNVTAEVKEQPWDVALHAILRAQGLAASEDASGIITVDSYKNIATTRSVEPLVTQIIEINYAKAASLTPILQTLLSRDCGVAPGAEVAGGNSAGASSAAQQNGGRSCLVRGSVTADTATNKLLITDVPSHLPEIAARLQELDVRTPQVAIKAKIIFVNRTGLEDIGLSYDLGTGTEQFFNQLVKRIDPSTRKPVDTNGDGVNDALGGGTPFDGDRISLGGNALSLLSNADRALAPSALNLIYSATIGRFQITSFLNALQQTSLADVQSEPSIVTLNNRTAEIFVGQQIPIRVIDASAGGGGGGGGGGSGNFPRATVRLEEAGIKLSVTPQVTNNRKVVLSVSAENSNAQAASSDVGVVFNRQRAENQLLVADGETAVIGGLTVTEKSRSKTGIPFLVDLPLVGRFFGQTSTSEVKRDLLILITPHILDEGETAPAPAIRR